MIRLPRAFRILMILRCLEEEEDRYSQEVGTDMIKYYEGLTVPEMLRRINESWEVVPTKEEKMFTLSGLYKYVNEAHKAGYITYDIHKEEYWGPVPVEPRRYYVTDHGKTFYYKLNYPPSRIEIGKVKIIYRSDYT